MDRSAQEDVRNGIDTLQLAQSERIFTKASNLFIKKWSRSHRILWNTFEATNRVVADENTFGERLPLSRLQLLVFEIVEKGSKSYGRSLKKHDDNQTITLHL